MVEIPRVFTTALVIFDPRNQPISHTVADLSPGSLDKLCFSTELIDAFSLWSACLIFFKEVLALSSNEPNSLSYLFGVIRRSRCKLLTKEPNYRAGLVFLDAVGTVMSNRHTAVLQTWILWSDVSQQQSPAERSLVLHAPLICGRLLADRSKYTKYTRAVPARHAKFPNIFYSAILRIRQVHNVYK